MRAAILAALPLLAGLVVGCGGGDHDSASLSPTLPRPLTRGPPGSGNTGAPPRFRRLAPASRPAGRIEAGT